MSQGEYDINLNPLKCSERQEPTETLFSNLNCPKYFKRHSMGIRVGLPKRIEFDPSDPSVHQLNLTVKVPPRGVNMPQQMGNVPNRRNSSEEEKHMLDDSEGGRRDSQRYKFNDVKGSQPKHEFD